MFKLSSRSKKDQNKVAVIHSDETYKTVTVSGSKFHIPAKYKPSKEIGKGAYGVVISAVNTQTDKKVAIKKIPDAFEDEIDAKRILREIKLLRHLQHENIMHIEDILKPQVASLAKFNDIYIIAALMETDLHRIIYSSQDLNEEHVQYFTFQILRALHYMHSANVLHRDLKPANLLVNSNCDLRVCDFGLARGVLPDEEIQDMELTQYVVTRWYRAPEIMLCSQTYTKAIDVWSVGCIMAELLARKPFLPGSNYTHQLQLIVEVLGTPTEKQLEFVTSSKAKRYMGRMAKKTATPFADLFPDASSSALDLLKKMLMFNPMDRIAVHEALRHPFFEQFRDVECPEAASLFSFDFENQVLTSDVIRTLIFKEAVDFPRGGQAKGGEKGESAEAAGQKPADEAEGDAEAEVLGGDQDKNFDEFINLLQKGGGLKIIKHPRRGNPSVKRLYLNDAKTQLLWEGRHGSGLALGDIYAVEAGMTTTVFQRTGHKSQEDRCFSLLTKERSLDLEAFAKEDRDNYVACFERFVGSGTENRVDSTEICN